jgi:hypothetical protein
MPTPKDLALARRWLAGARNGRTEARLAALLRRVRLDERKSLERDMKQAAAAIEVIATNGGDCPVSRPPFRDLCPRITRADQAVARAALARLRARSSDGA